MSSSNGSILNQDGQPADCESRSIDRDSATAAADSRFILPIPATSDQNEAISDGKRSDHALPPVVTDQNEFLWDDDQPPVEKYAALGRRLFAAGDLFRSPAHGGDLLLVGSSDDEPVKPITSGKILAAVIADRVRIRAQKKNGKPSGCRVPATDLNTMLAAEVFLQQFLPLDRVVTAPMYMADFATTEPGYNDGGAGQRILHIGGPAIVSDSMETITKFLDVMAFESGADRSNAVAAALTVVLRNHWHGAKPIVAVTSSKSHGGKDTVIKFAAGRTPISSISYDTADWATQKNFAALVKYNPNLGVVNIENVRPGRQCAVMRSAFLERFLTDPSPVLYSTGTGDPTRRKNDIVLATSTNFGALSTDLMNRALPIRLNPVGNVAERTTAIGNPKLEFLPANAERIEAELRGMIERWKAEGLPQDVDAKHPFSQWAHTVGGILKVNGFEEFLSNYQLRQSEDDPVRKAIGLLGAHKADDCLPPSEWVEACSDLGLTKTLIPEADRESEKSRRRGIGVVLSAHRDETFVVETDDAVITLRLEKSRRRINGGNPATRYEFVAISETPLPIDEDE